MSILLYAWRELSFRRSRSLIAVLSFAIAVLAAVLLTALAASYARAVRAPIETVGADVIVQITGDIPPKLEGLVFPHPNALVPAAAVAAIRAMDGRHLGDARGLYVGTRAQPLSIDSGHRRQRGGPGLALVPPD